MSVTKYSIGIDFGSDSVRALIVNTATGQELATAVHYYARWKAGKYCSPSDSSFRQHPLDYIEGIESTIKSVVSQVEAEVVKNIVGIGVDTTGSTPVAVNKSGTPLALLPGLKRIQMPCLYCGKIIPELEKQQRSMHMLKNLIPIICSLSAVFIHQNGSGQNCCMYCVPMKK